MSFDTCQTNVVDISVWGKYKFSVSSRVFDVQLNTCVSLLSITMVAGF